MAIPRPFLLALLGALLLGATFFAVQSSRDSAGGDAAPAAQQAQPAEQAAAPAEPAPATSPEELLQAAFSGGEVESTAFSAEVSIDVQGASGSLDLKGAFQQGAANDVPEFEVSAAAQPQTIAFPVDPQSWVRSVESEGTETIDGVETTHVSATLDPERVVRDTVDAVRATGQQLPDAGAIAKAVKRGEFQAWIGTDDRVVRRLNVDVAFARRGELSLDLELSGVNQPQDIEAPAKVRQGMPDGVFGAFAQGVVTGLSGGAEPVSLAALTSRNPQRAARAVADGRKVVILFQNPDGLDDRAMRGVVRKVDARTRALVLTDHVDAVDRYGSMVEDLGVSQTPAVVLIDSRGAARLIEGYVDTDTLAQAVADAR